jgi:hypothetical protein
MMKRNIRYWFVEIFAVILNLVFALTVLMLSRSSGAISEDTEFLVVATVATITVLLLVVKNDMIKQVRQLENRTGRLVTLFDPLTSSIPTQSAPRWEGQWASHWLIHDGEDDFVPYVDDGVTIEEIAPQLGIVEGIGHSAYDYGGTYALEGRMISSRIAILTYKTFYTPLEDCEGAVMLRMDRMGKISGWWMANNEDVGGLVIFERHDNNEPFEFKFHQQSTGEHN